MARSAAGRELTQQQYASQLRLKALALRDFMRLWPTWTGDEKSFREMATATVVLVRAYQQLSGQLGASYFDAFRLAEDPGGHAKSWLADPMTAEAEDKLIGSMFETGQYSLQRSLAAGKSPESARGTALTNVSGIVTNSVLDGGRGAILRSTANDERAKGWARVTSGKPCSFCALLSSRGPVYISESTADFQAHGHCSCTAEPGYQGTAWPGRSREFHDFYNEAILQARENGELDNSKNYLLNAFRRAYEKKYLRD